MKMLWLNVSIILIAQVINGIILPGPCPKPLSTQYPSHPVHVTYQVVFIAPFSSRASNLFRNISTDVLLLPSLAYSDSDKIFLFFSKHRINYGVYNLYDNNKPEAVSVNAKPTKNLTTGETEFLTNIEDWKNKALCYKPLYEPARVWHEVKNYILIWSCSEVQMDKKVTHDAALIYGIEISDFPQNHKMYQQMIGKFRSQAKSIFNETWEDLVKWPKQMPVHNSSTHPLKDFFKCQIITQYTSGYLIGSVVLFVVILIILGIFKDAVKNICHRNKIHPM